MSNYSSFDYWNKRYEDEKGEHSAGRWLVTEQTELTRDLKLQ